MASTAFPGPQAPLVAKARAPLVAWLCLGAWFAAGAAMHLGGTWLFQNLWILELLPFAVHLLWGVAQTAWFALVLRRWRLAAVMVAGLVGFWFGSALLSDLGDRAAFVFIRPAFDRVVAQKTGLVAFAWTAGVPDGGSAIVFDPDDALARPIDPGAAIKEDVDRLVNGNVRACSRFANPHYYMCSFG
jgi:hypothetical protein